MAVDLSRGAAGQSNNGGRSRDLHTIRMPKMSAQMLDSTNSIQVSNSLTNGTSGSSALEESRRTLIDRINIHYKLSRGDGAYQFTGREYNIIQHDIRQNAETNRNLESNFGVSPSEPRRNPSRQDEEAAEDSRRQSAQRKQVQQQRQQRVQQAEQEKRDREHREQVRLQQQKVQRAQLKRDKQQKLNKQRALAERHEQEQEQRQQQEKQRQQQAERQQVAKAKAQGRQQQQPNQSQNNQQGSSVPDDGEQQMLDEEAAEQQQLQSQGPIGDEDEILNEMDQQQSQLQNQPQSQQQSTQQPQSQQQAQQQSRPQPQTQSQSQDDNAQKADISGDSLLEGLVNNYIHETKTGTKKPKQSNSQADFQQSTDNYNRGYGYVAHLKYSPWWQKIQRDVKDDSLTDLDSTGSTDNLNSDKIRIGFTGARDFDKNDGANLKSAMSKMDKNPKVVPVTGLANGSDTYVTNQGIRDGKHVIEAVPFSMKRYANAGGKTKLGYPDWKSNNFKRVIDNGGECLSREPKKYSPSIYQDRNRIISGISSALVATKVKLNSKGRSGTLNTIDDAYRRQHKPIYIIPQNNTDKMNSYLRNHYGVQPVSRLVDKINGVQNGRQVNRTQQASQSKPQPQSRPQQQQRHYRNSRKIYYVDGNNRVNSMRLPYSWKGGHGDNYHTLHQRFQQQLGHKVNVHEISSASDNKLDKGASAFNLRLRAKSGSFSLESVYQAAKVFSNGSRGTIADMKKSPGQAKRIARNRGRGAKLQGFQLGKHKFPLTPKTFFYDWIYARTLAQPQNKAISDRVKSGRAFGDIFANPDKTVSTQAHTCAIYSSLARRGVLGKSLSNPRVFMKEAYGYTPDGAQKQNQSQNQSQNSQVVQNQNANDQVAEQISRMRKKESLPDITIKPSIKDSGTVVSDPKSKRVVDENGGVDMAKRRSRPTDRKTIGGSNVELYLRKAVGTHYKSKSSRGYRTKVKAYFVKRSDIDPNAPFAGDYVTNYHNKWDKSHGKNVYHDQTLTPEAFNRVLKLNNKGPVSKDDIISSAKTGRPLVDVANGDNVAIKDSVFPSADGPKHNGRPDYVVNPTAKHMRPTDHKFNYSNEIKSRVNTWKNENDNVLSPMQKAQQEDLDNNQSSYQNSSQNSYQNGPTNVQSQDDGPEV